MPARLIHVEAKFLAELRKFSDRNPHLGLLHSHLLEMAAGCSSVLPKPSPTESEPRRSSRSMAVKAAVRPVAASAVPSDTGAGSQSPNGRERAIQRRRADPTACAVLALIAIGASNRTISEELELTIHTVKCLVAAWKKATEIDDRAALAAWAWASGAVAGPAVQQ